MPFPYINITNLSARYALAFCLGLIHVILGVVQIMQGFEQVNQTALCGSSRMVVDGAEDIYNVIRAREKSWEYVGKQVFSVLSLLVLDAIFRSLAKR